MANDTNRDGGERDEAEKTRSQNTGSFSDADRRWSGAGNDSELDDDLGV